VVVIKGGMPIGARVSQKCVWNYFTHAVQYSSSLSLNRKEFRDAFKNLSIKLLKQGRVA